MSLQQSYLSQAAYGYDTVVAISQYAINASIRTYFQNINGRTSSHPFPINTYYFATDDTGFIDIIDINSLTPLTNGVDPMKVPSWDGTGNMPASISNVMKSKFKFAFTFQLGNPSTDFIAFDYIKLNPLQQSVTYYLLCKTLQIVFWNPDNNTWVNVTQTAANQFNINASVNLKTVPDNTNLPPGVQAAVTALGNIPVTVQQLLLDVGSAVVNPTSSFPGLDSSCSVFPQLMHWFLLSYFGLYKELTVPALAYSLTQPGAATLAPTGMGFYADAFVDANSNVVTNPSVDEQNLATLNYIFPVNGDALPEGKQLSWNWLDNNAPGSNPALPALDPNAEVNLYAGVLAVSRQAFGKYLASQLKAYVLNNYWMPTVTANKDGYEFDVNFQDGVLGANDGLQPYDANSVKMGDPDLLLKYIASHSNSAKGLWADGDHMDVTAYFQLTVEIDAPSANTSLRQTLTLTQTLWLSVDASQQNNAIPSYTGNPFKKTFTDVFAITVDNKGMVAFGNISSNVDDESDAPSALPSYVTEALGVAINWAAAISFTQIPVSMPKQFTFPGGNAFSFKDAQFSQYSDLVCHIQYDAIQ